MYLVERLTATVSLLAAPGPRQPEVVLDRFAFDRTDLTADHQRKIDQLADQIVASWKSNRPALGVEMVGHTDQQGTSTTTMISGGVERSGCSRP
jgi:outer membrane protein OmpA-like peptidoglycan-associated protein